MFNLVSHLRNKLCKQTNLYRCYVQTILLSQATGVHAIKKSIKSEWGLNASILILKYVLNKMHEKGEVRRLETVIEGTRISLYQLTSTGKHVLTQELENRLSNVL